MGLTPPSRMRLYQMRLGGGGKERSDAQPLAAESSECYTRSR